MDSPDFWYIDPYGSTAWDFAKGTTVGFVPSTLKGISICSGLVAAYTINPVFGAVCSVGVAGYYGYHAISHHWNSISSFGSTVRNAGVFEGYQQIKTGIYNKYNEFQNLSHYDKGLAFRVYDIIKLN